MEHFETDRIDLEDVAGACRLPPGTAGLDLAQVLLIEVGAQGLSGLDHQAWGELSHHGGNASEVIGVSVRHDDGLQPPDTVPIEERNHHLPTRIEGPGTRTAIDQHPSPVRRPDRDGIPLTDIQEV